MKEGGVKHDSDKPQMNLLPPLALEEVAQILTFGAKKYGSHNWRGGMKWSRLTAATLRHLFAFIRGEDLDPESGRSHIAHAACNLMFLLEFIKLKEYSRFDDRYKSNLGFDNLERLRPHGEPEL